MNTKIERATENDFLEIAKLRWAFKANNNNYEQDFLKSYREYLRSEHDLKRLVVFIAKEKNIIIGNINLIIIPKSPKPYSKISRIGYLTNSYVKPAYRNKRIGERIIKEIISFAKANHIELLIVWPSEESTSFYSRYGFSKDNEILENILYDDTNSII